MQQFVTANSKKQCPQIKQRGGWKLKKRRCHTLNRGIFTFRRNNRNFFSKMLKVLVIECCGNRETINPRQLN